MPVEKYISSSPGCAISPFTRTTITLRLAAAATLFLATTAFTVPPFNLQPRLPTSTSATPLSTPAVDVATTVLPSIALVEPSGVRNITSRGSAFTIDYPPTQSTDTNTEPEYIYLLTAAHVAAPGTQLHISFPPPNDSPSERHQAEVVGREEASDLALLRIPVPPGGVAPPPLRLGGTPPLGTDAYAFGFPPGMIGDSPAMSRGIVCGMAGWPERRMGGRFRGRGRRRKGNDVEEKEEKESVNSNEDGIGGARMGDATFVVTDAAMSPGMSGGPLTDSAGIVLGLCALVRPDAGGIGNYAVSADTIQRFIEGLQRKGTEDGVRATAVGYRVVLFNDRMNTRKQVDYVLRDVATLDAGEAKTVMMSAHRTGRGVVKDFYADLEDSVLDTKGRAEALCTALQGADVLAEVEEISEETS